MTNIRFSFQVFSHAKAYFSIGGEHFFPEPVSYTYPADTIMPEARNVTVKLHHRTGRFLKLQLFFANKWMMISEISFESRKFKYNCMLSILSRLWLVLAEMSWHLTVIIKLSGRDFFLSLAFIYI